MAETCLVTGGGGFVMSNVVKAWLHAEESRRCIVLDLGVVKDDAYERMLGAYEREGRLEYIEGSVTNPAVWEQLKPKSITHIVHGAAITPTNEEEKANPARIMEVNMMGTVCALNFAVSLLTSDKKFVRMIYVSSDGVFNQPGLARPASPTDGAGPWPQPLYCVTKYACEKMVERYAQMYSMEALTVRFSDVYGPMDRDTGSRNRHNEPYWVCQRHNQGLPIRYRGELSDYGCDYIYAPDAALAVVKILSHPSKPKQQVYNLSLGRPVPLQELLAAVSDDTLASAVPAEAQEADAAQVTASEEQGAKPTKYDPYSGKANCDIATIPPNHHLRMSPYTLDSEPTKTEFEWQPRSLKDAMADYVTWLKEAAS